MTLRDRVSASDVDGYSLLLVSLAHGAILDALGAALAATVAWTLGLLGSSALQLDADLD